MIEILTDQLKFLKVNRDRLKRELDAGVKVERIAKVRDQMIMVETGIVLIKKLMDKGKDKGVL